MHQRDVFMKKLYIIRHAKSSWSNLILDDFDRPLNNRGKLNAVLIAKRLKEKKIPADMIISSPANRAKTTTNIIIKTIKYSKDIVFNKDVYEATFDELHNILIDIDDDKKIVFLIGHNPGLNILAEYYVGFKDNIPTSGVLEIEFNSDKWINISMDNSKLLSFDYPKKDFG